MTERDKIIEVIKQADADFHELFREGVKRVRDGEISRFTNHDVRPTYDEILADKLIAAGIGAVEEIKKEAEYWKNEAITARADIDDAVEEITKRIFSELRDYFVEQSAYAADCNQHTGYRDYEIKASDVVCDIVAIAEKYGVELGAKYDD